MRPFFQYATYFINPVVKTESSILFPWVFIRKDGFIKIKTNRLDEGNVVLAIDGKDERFNSFRGYFRGKIPKVMHSLFRQRRRIVQLQQRLGVLRYKQ